MSDYFDILIAKSLGSADIVQPRLASLFEPPTAAGQFIAERFALEPLSTLSSGVTSAAQPAHSLETDSPAVHPATPSHSLGRPPSNSIDQATSQPPPPPFISHQPVMPVPRAHISTPHTVVAAASTADEERTSTPEVTHQNEPAALSAGWRATSPEDHAAIPSQDKPFVAPATDVRPASLEPAASAPMTIPFAATSRPAATPTGADAARTPAPTIKITIGRVDVRAVMPAASAPPPAPAQRRPALSLDDYLKRREGGQS